MVIIWIILLIGFLYVLQLFLYNRYWKAGVVTSVRFKQSAIFEDEQGKMLQLGREEMPFDVNADVIDYPLIKGTVVFKLK